MRAFPKLTFNQPLYVKTEPGTDDVLVISHDGGYEGPAHFVRLRNTPDADKTEPFLDMNRIAYGVAFHPDYAKNGYVYVGSNGPDGEKVKMDRVSRFTVERKPPYRCDPKSEVVILEWASNGHNGGDLELRPGRLSLRHVRRRHQRFRRRPTRPGPDAPDGQGAAHRRGPPGRGQGTTPCRRTTPS